jgi:uncharacterized membrane protein YfcA
MLVLVALFIGQTILFLRWRRFNRLEWAALLLLGAGTVVL